MGNTEGSKDTALNLELICDTGRLLHATMGVSCIAIDLANNKMVEIPADHVDGCFCKQLAKITNRSANIDHMFVRCRESSKDRSPLIYSCPWGLANIVAPVFNGNELVAALQVGPILIKDPDELLHNALTETGISSAAMAELKELLAGFPNRNSDFLLALSETITLMLSSKSPAIGRYQSLAAKNNELKEYNRSSYNVVDAALEYIASNYTSNITLKTVADNTYVHPAHLSRMFSKHVKCHFRNYINDKRINLAKELLQDPSLSITAICSEVGFSDQSYFDKVFKRIEGVTPSQYRKSCAARTAAEDK